MDRGYTTLDETLDLDAHVALGRDLISSWMVDRPSVLVRNHPAHRVAIVHGLCAHAHHLARPALDLIENGDALSAVSLVRTIYEGALTAHWTVQVRDASEAFILEENRQRSKLRRSVTASSIASSFAEGAALTAHGDAAQHAIETTSATQAQHFKHLTNDLAPGGSDAYTYYGFLSHLTHASGMTAEHYVELTEASPGVRLLQSPKRKPLEADWLAFFIAASLVWAGRARDMIELDHPRRKELRQAARRLGIAVELQPSQAAWFRTSRRSKSP
ncbi:MAG: DUF5677 domain-containing protein [Propionibacteriaceae bacterium]